MYDFLMTSRPYVTVLCYLMTAVLIFQIVQLRNMRKRIERERVEDDDHEWLWRIRPWVMRSMHESTFNRIIEPFMWIAPLRPVFSSQQLHIHKWHPFGDVGVRVIDTNTTRAIYADRVALRRCDECHTSRSNGEFDLSELFRTGALDMKNLDKQLRVEFDDIPGIGTAVASGVRIEHKHRDDE